MRILAIIIKLAEACFPKWITNFRWIGTWINWKIYFTLTVRILATIPKLTSACFLETITNTNHFRSCRLIKPIYRIIPILRIYTYIMWILATISELAVPRISKCIANPCLNISWIHPVLKFTAIPVSTLSHLEIPAHLLFFHWSQI